jgi:hypothetical protein
MRVFEEMNTTISQAKTMPLLACKVTWVKQKNLIVSRSEAVALWREMADWEPNGTSLRKLTYRKGDGEAFDGGNEVMDVTEEKFTFRKAGENLVKISYSKEVVA